MIATRLFDRVLFLLAVGGVIVSGIFMYRTSDTSLRVVIESGQNEWQYPLNNNARIEIPGKIGVTVIEIQDGSVRIAESPCPNHTCVARGAVHTAGIPLVCLPNAVCVTIRGGASPEDELDAIGH